MSALGQKQTSRPRWTMSALPPKADIDRRDGPVRLTPRHRVVKRHRTSNAERPQPCQLVWKITETFAEKNPRLQRVGCIGADSLGP